MNYSKNYTNTKPELMQFLIWTRNGFAFCTSWFLILLLIYSHFLNIKSIPTEQLTGMLLFVAGGAFLFSFFFTRLFIKKWSFLKRLTCFLLFVSFYESIGFYKIGFFTGSGAFTQWLGFIGILLFSYFISIGIYQLYSAKQGRLYTQALQQYQKERKIEHEK